MHMRRRSCAYSLFIAVLWVACSLNAPEPEAGAPLKRHVEQADTGRTFSIAELMGQFNPATHADFERVEAAFAGQPNLYLRREAAVAFAQMARAAQADGIVLKAISATRTFNHQKGIWERKWRERAADIPDPVERARSILEYSAMPGTSRHHWGTDIDLNAIENEDFEPGGRYEKAYHWLRQHAHRFGFCQPYTPYSPERPHGYREEKWHWSYQPLAGPMLRQYALHITDAHLKGFAGSEIAAHLQVVQHYVLGIDNICQ